MLIPVVFGIQYLSLFWTIMLNCHIRVTGYDYDYCSASSDNIPDPANEHDERKSDCMKPQM